MVWRVFYLGTLDAKGLSESPGAAAGMREAMQSSSARSFCCCAPAYGGADTSWRLCSPSDAPCGERSCNRLCSLSDASRPAQPQPPTLAPHVVARVRLTVALRMSDMQARRGALDASPRCVHALGNHRNLRWYPRPSRHRLAKPCTVHQVLAFVCVCESEAP